MTKRQKPIENAIAVGPNGEVLVDDTFDGIPDNFRQDLENASVGVERFVGPRTSDDI